MACGKDQDRIEVEFLHLRQLIGEPGEAKDRVLQRGKIAWWVAVETPQECRAFGRAEHFARIGDRERSDSEADIAQSLNHDAAQSKSQ